MQKITLICVGKLKERHFLAACAEYEKRLRAFCTLTIQELSEIPMPDRASDAQVAQALAREAGEIEKKIPRGAVLIPLCIEGELLSSEALAARMARFAGEGSASLCFLIGGSNGLSEALKERGVLRLSLSRMTFPHHLARVMLLEQIYRAFQIGQGGSYHK